MKKITKDIFKKKWAKIAGLVVFAIIVVFLIRATVFLQSLFVEWIIVLAVFALLYFGGKKLIDKFRYRNIQTKIEDAQAVILNAQEKQILVRMADGFTNKEIGDQIFISESAVKKHVTSIFVKLNAKRRTEAVRIARDAHLIS